MTERLLEKIITRMQVGKVRRWITALRSKKYTQIRGRLHGKYGVKGETHCALGVADAEGLLSMLPVFAHPIVLLNDVEKKTFTEIADLLEAELPPEPIPVPEIKLPDHKLPAEVQAETKPARKLKN